MLEIKLGSGEGSVREAMLDHPRHHCYTQHRVSRLLINIRASRDHGTRTSSPPIRTPPRNLQPRIRERRLTLGGRSLQFSLLLLELLLVGLVILLSDESPDPMNGVVAR
jgi:hypothetical protein